MIVYYSITFVEKNLMKLKYAFVTWFSGRVTNRCPNLCMGGRTLLCRSGSSVSHGECENLFFKSQFTVYSYFESGISMEYR